MRGRGWVTTGALLAGALVLAGCGGEPAAEQLPPPPSLGPSEVPASDPAPTAAPDPAAQVEQAVREYYDAINAAQYEGAIDELEAKSTPDCNCRQLPSSLRETLSEGRLMGGEWRLVDVTVQDVQGDTASVLAVVDVADGQVVDDQGQVLVNVNNEGRIVTLHSMTALNGRWLVARNLKEE